MVYPHIQSATQLDIDVKARLFSWQSFEKHVLGYPPQRFPSSLLSSLFSHKKTKPIQGERVRVKEESHERATSIEGNLHGTKRDKESIINSGSSLRDTANVDADATESLFKLHFPSMCAVVGYDCSDSHEYALPPPAEPFTSDSHTPHPLSGQKREPVSTSPSALNPKDALISSTEGDVGVSIAEILELDEAARVSTETAETRKKKGNFWEGETRTKSLIQPDVVWVPAVV